jgi:hypothetical protein
MTSDNLTYADQLIQKAKLEVRQVEGLVISGTVECWHATYECLIMI